eukprot:2681442-Amphidinium_carterae.2
MPAYPHVVACQGVEVILNLDHLSLGKYAADCGSWVSQASAMMHSRAPAQAHQWLNIGATFNGSSPFFTGHLGLARCCNDGAES